MQHQRQAKKYTIPSRPTKLLSTDSTCDATNIHYLVETTQLKFRLMQRSYLSVCAPSFTDLEEQDIPRNFLHLRDSRSEEVFNAMRNFILTLVKITTSAFLK